MANQMVVVLTVQTAELADLNRFSENAQHIPLIFRVLDGNPDVVDNIVNPDWTNSLIYALQYNAMSNWKHQSAHVNSNRVYDNVSSLLVMLTRLPKTPLRRKFLLSYAFEPYGMVAQLGDFSPQVFKAQPQALKQQNESAPQDRSALTWYYVHVITRAGLEKQFIANVKKRRELLSEVLSVRDKRQRTSGK